MKKKILWGDLRGRVLHGEKIGRKLGYPTANLARHYFNRHPVSNGVYAGITTIKNKNYAVAAVVGVDGKIEAHIIGWRGNLYGSFLVVHLVARLRALVPYTTDARLRKQIVIDLKVTQRLTALYL
jgi:riboflavin kinase/FMN adenylyltransferase